MALSPSIWNSAGGGALQLGGRNPGYTTERVHPWLLEAQQNALRQGGLLGGGGGGGGGFGGGGSGSVSTSGPGMDGYQQLSDSLLGQIQQQGGSQREDINRSYDTSLDSSLARLSDRGFGNSSLVESTEGASQRNRQSSLTNLNDSLLGQQIGVQSQVGLAGLNAQQQRQMQWQNQLFGGLFG